MNHTMPSQNEETRIHNPLTEDFTGYYNRTQDPNGFTIKAGQTRILPRFVAEIIGKHLVDKVLKAKHPDIKDTNRDTPIRRSVYAEVLPDITLENPEVKKLEGEEEQEAIRELLKSQQTQIDELKKKDDELKKKDEESADDKKKIADLEAELEKYKAEEAKQKPEAPNKKTGRPRKVEETTKE